MSDRGAAGQQPATIGNLGPVRVRLAQVSDIPALLQLETLRWSPAQAATAQDFQHRIRAYPGLSLLALRPPSSDGSDGSDGSDDHDDHDGTLGEIVASAFLRPVSAAQVLSAATWADCLEAPETPSADSLFGISFTSIDPGAVRQLVAAIGPPAIAAGWQRFYLGSLVPGLSEWSQRHPGAPAEHYVLAQNPDGLPLDPLLRYYHRLGLGRIEAIRPGYFPHPESLDHGVVISGSIPEILSLALGTQRRERAG